MSLRGPGNQASRLLQRNDSARIADANMQANFKTLHFTEKKRGMSLCFFCGEKDKVYIFILRQLGIDANMLGACSINTGAGFHC